MKIGIITQPLRTNYGGLLQAYALQTVLERMGHEVEILDQPVLLKQKLIRSCLSRIKSFLLRRKVDYSFVKRYNHDYPIVSQNTQPFIEKYHHRREVKRLCNLHKGEYDAFVVGSDQVWRPQYNTHITDQFLKFAKRWKSVKRVAYAASFGTDAWEYPLKLEKECRALAQKFDAISVREQSGVRLVQEHFSMPSVHVLDPTLLLSPSDYEQLIDAAPVERKSCMLFAYVLDKSPEKMAIIERMAQEHGLTPYVVSVDVPNFQVPAEERVQPSVEQWLNSFRDASMVFTDSFHACVFSIIFQKQFVVYGNKERGMSRFDSLLSLFSLNNRLVSTPSQCSTLSPIDFTPVLTKLTSLQQLSVEYLKRALKSR